MQAGQLQISYELAKPSVWAGTYTSNNKSSDASWSWYKDGDNKLVKFPHVTVAFGLTHEVAANGEWKGFHVSIPMGGINARFNYKIQNGKAVYSNMTKTNMRDDQIKQATEIANRDAAIIDEFATAFYNAAMGIK